MEEDSGGGGELMPEKMKFGSHEQHPEEMARFLGEPWPGKGKGVEFSKNLAQEEE